jgi:hypothetical protein
VGRRTDEQAGSLKEGMMTRRLLVCLGVALFAVPAVAEAQYFGRNKVQYRSFDFHVIRTEHFDVYYYPQKREAALDAARMIERSYARLSRLLQHEFAERKPVILYASHSEFQQTNALGMFLDEGTGGVTESAKHRIIMPFTGSYAEFDHVLTHELVHQFQYDVLFRSVAGDANPFAMRLPLWFMEGMAEYLAIGHVDPHTQSWLRDAVLAGYLRTIGEMNQRDDYLSYRFGQSLWAYIGEKWGDEVVGILLQKAPRLGVHRAIASTLGVSIEELSDEWTASVRRTYMPRVATFDRPETFAQRLSAHATLRDPWYVAPAISPDGTRMVFTSQQDGFSFDLWLADAQTGVVQRKLVNAARNPDFESLRYMSSGAAFSPDGRYLAFAAQTGGRDALYIYDLQRFRVIKRLRYDLNGLSNPSWSPDGQRLVFSGNSGGLTDLYITDLNGKLQRLTADRYAALLPAWSPDGQRIAFTTDRGPTSNLDVLTYGNHRVAIYDLDTRHVEVLPHQDEGKNINPVWSPDGAQLVWVGDRTGTNNLYVYDFAERTLDRMTDVLSGVIAITPLSPVLSWARTGRLLFNYFEHAGYSIYAVDDPLALPRTPVDAAPAVVATSPVGDNGDDVVRGDENGRGNGGAHGDATLDGNGFSAAARGDDSRAAQPAVPMAVDTPAVLRYDVASYYRSAQGLRASAARVAAETDVAPVSVLALLDSAVLALPDTADFEMKPYRVRFSPDFIGRPTVGAQVGGHYGAGLYGGSFIALSDMLGDHNILVAGNINGSLSDASFYSGYSYLKTRANFGIAISQQPLYRYLGGGHFPLSVKGVDEDVAANVYLRDVVRSAQGFVSYPINTFRRVELGASGTYYKRDVLYRGYVRESGDLLDEDRRIGALTYLQPMVAMVFDNTLFGWTGPVSGRRYRLQYSQTRGDLGFHEALIDFRNYLRIQRSIVFATRVVTLARMGGSAEQFRNYWGGPYFLRGYDGGSFRSDSDECAAHRPPDASATLGRLSACPARDQLVGSSAAVFNAEVRFPIITELQLGALGSFPPVDALVFFDGGMAWDQEICGAADFIDPSRCASGEAQPVRIAWRRQPGDDPRLVRTPLYSYGVGVRMNIFYAVLRLDYSFPLNRPGFDGRKGLFSLSFGPSF